jgi:opacity protein-like surface antigen
MHMKKKMVVSMALAAVLGALTTAAYADGEWYGGVSIGSAKAHPGDDALGNFPGSTSDTKTSSTGFKVFGGKALSPRWDFEVSYAYLGNVVERTWSAPASTAARLNLAAWSAALAGKLPLGGSGFSVFGKLGPYLADQSVVETDPAFGDQRSNATQTGWMTGAGAAWRLNSQWSVRAEWERYWTVGKNLTINQGTSPTSGARNGAGFNVDLISIGAAFHF